MASSSLYCSTGSSALGFGAIVGALPNPYGAAQLSAGQFFTSGDQDLGGDGELGGQTVFTVEFWFMAHVLPAGNEVITNGPMTSTGTTTRQWTFTLNSAGTISFAARTSTPATITATSAQVLAVDVWYHIVGRVDGTNLKVYVNGVESGTAAWGGLGVQVRGTTPGSMDTVVGSSVSTQTYSFDEFAIYRFSLGSDRILAHYQAGTQRGFPNDVLPGAHVLSALDAITSRAPRRIYPGTRAMGPSFYGGNTPLDEIQSARLAENVDATYFVSRSGEIVFLDAGHRSSAPYNTAQTTMGDAGGTEIPYEDLGVDYSDATIANEWNVTNASSNGGTFGAQSTTQTASDATSIASYGHRPQDITGVPLNLFAAGNAALDIANAMLAKYKDPVLRGTSVHPNPGDPSVAEVVFDRDLGDRINVKRTPPGGGARISQDLFIQQIQISGSNDGTPWNVTWGVSPL